MVLPRIGILQVTGWLGKALIEGLWVSLLDDRWVLIVIQIEESLWGY